MTMRHSSFQQGKGNVLVIVVVLAIIALGVFYIGPSRLLEYFNMQGITSPSADDSMKGAAPPVVTGKEDLIRVTSPLSNDVVKSPLTITGEARGYWYFEASFPVRLLDANGNEIPTDPGFIQAGDDWMTEDFVPFSALITFTPPASNTGTLILKKDNPSGLPENDDELRIPVRFR